jgi:hypothetical protein
MTSVDRPEAIQLSARHGSWVFILDRISVYPLWLVSWTMWAPERGVEHSTEVMPTPRPGQGD